MAHYFTGRKFAGDLIEHINERKMLLCRMQQFWEFRNSGECYCERKGNVEVCESREISEKESRSFEGAIESTLVVLGLANLKSSVKGSLGYEVGWSAGTSKRASFEIGPAPKCGREELKVFELMTEFEVSVFERGFIFKKDTWDKKPIGTLREGSRNYAAIPTREEWDDQCKCATEVPPSPEFEGRISFDLGKICLVLPYRDEKSGMRVRFPKSDVSLRSLSITSMGLQREGREILVLGVWVGDELWKAAGFAGETAMVSVATFEDEIRAFKPRMRWDTLKYIKKTQWLLGREKEGVVYKSEFERDVKKPKAPEKKRGST